jgi:hypothetical protein
MGIFDNFTAPRDGGHNSFSGFSGGDSRQSLHAESLPFLASRQGIASGDMFRTVADNSSAAPMELTDNTAKPVSNIFDQAKSPSELAQAGLIKDRTSENPEQKAAAITGTDTNISVDFKNSDALNSGNRPDFIVKQDGTVEMLSDPEKTGNKQVSIAVERGDGQLYPSPEQQKAADELATYLAARLRKDSPAEKVNVSDDSGLLSDNAKANAGLNNNRPTANMDPQTAGQVNRANRLGGNNGEMTQRDAADYFPPRDVPRQLNESEKLAQTKDAAAALFNPDKDKPYETIRQKPNGEHAVGRYGFNGRQLHNFLAGLGDPPDPELIEKLIREGKLPKDFAEKLKNPEFLKKMKDFASSMQNGTAPNKDQVKEFLPKEFQEQVAGKLAGDLAGKFPDSPGKVAAAMVMGKTADSVTDQDMQSPEAKTLTTAGDKFYNLANARDHANPDTDSVKWNKEGRISIGGNRWLEADAASALDKAKQMAAADGVSIQINSAGRTYEEQARLYARLHGKSPVAPPGHSNHESGRALDIQNWQQAKKYLLAAGFRHGDGNGPIAGDLVHFSYPKRRS